MAFVRLILSDAARRRLLGLAPALATALAPAAAGALGRPSITVQWQQMSSTNPAGLPNPYNLGRGQMVNNDPGSLVRIEVQGIPDNCWVTQTHLYAQHVFGDDDLGDLGPPDSEANRRNGPTYDTQWDGPHTSPTVSPFYHQTDLFAEVSVRCEVSGGKFEDVAPPPYKSGILSVPDRHIVADEESSATESKVDLNAKGTGTAGHPDVNGAQAAGAGHFGRTSSGRQVSDRKLLDPDYTTAVVLRDPLPPGWSLQIAPAAFSLSLGQTQDLDLVYRAPTPGAAVYAIRTTAKTPNGTYTSVTPPQLLIVDRGAVERQLAKVAVGSHRYDLLYTMPGSVSLTAAQAMAGQTRTVTLSVQHAAAGPLELFIPRQLVGAKSPLTFTVDGRPIVPLHVVRNSLVTIVRLPLGPTTSQVTISGRI